MFPVKYFPFKYYPGKYFPPDNAGPGGGGGGGSPDPIWEDATIITRVTRGTQLTTAVVPSGTWRLFIKAFDTTGNESAVAAIFDIEVKSGNDVVIDQISHPRWPGILTDFIKHDVSGFLVPDSLNLASDDGFETFDEFVVNPVLLATYETVEIDMGFDSTVRIFSDLAAVLGPGETGAADPLLTIDYHVGLGSYDGFEDWTVGTVEARFIKARVKIDTTTGVASLKQVRIIADVPERIEGDKSVAIAGSGGTAINFATPFHIIPRVDVTADASTALIATKRDVTTTGFTAQVWNTSGGDVGGNIDWSAIGA